MARKLLPIFKNHLGAVVPQQSQHEDAALSVLKKDPESEDYLDRWRESWLEQSALNLPKEMFALLLKTAIGGFFGDLVGAVVKALWPPGIPKEQRMMEILIQWTKDHVDAEFLKHLRETVQAILDTSMRGPMDDYQMCSQKVKEEAKKAWFFPETHFQECLSHLDPARDFASLARNNIVASSWRGGRHSHLLGDVLDCHEPVAGVLRCNEVLRDLVALESRAPARMKVANSPGRILPRR